MSPAARNSIRVSVGRGTRKGAWAFPGRSTSPLGRQLAQISTEVWLAHLKPLPQEWLLDLALVKNGAQDC